MMMVLCVVIGVYHKNNLFLTTNGPQLYSNYRSNIPLLQAQAFDFLSAVILNAIEWNATAVLFAVQWWLWWLYRTITFYVSLYCIVLFHACATHPYEDNKTKFKTLLATFLISRISHGWRKYKQASVQREKYLLQWDFLVLQVGGLTCCLQQHSVKTFLLRRPNDSWAGQNPISGCSADWRRRMELLTVWYKCADFCTTPHGVTPQKAIFSHSPPPVLRILISFCCPKCPYWLWGSRALRL